MSMNVSANNAGSEEMLASALLGIRSRDSDDADIGIERSKSSEPSQISMGTNGDQSYSQPLCHPDFRGMSMNGLASLGLRTRPPTYPQNLLPTPSLASFTNLLHLQQGTNPTMILSREAMNGFHPQARPMPQSSQVTTSMPPAAAAAAGAPPSSGAANSTPQAVHKEKIESALRSHPQRGKKRDELNEEERHELTRTRNREHARATRVRKKHRYEELLEKENQLHERRQVQNLERQRREAVVDLFRARETRIRSLSASDGSSSVQLVDSSEKTHASYDGPIDRQEGVTPPIHDENAESRPSNEYLKETQRMAQFDKSIAKRIEDGFGHSSLAKFTYSVTGQANGVALDCNNGALATVEVMVAGASTHPLVKGLVYILFVPKSATLQSVSWTTLEESLGAA